MSWGDLICLLFRQLPMKTVKKLLSQTTFALGNAGPFIFLEPSHIPTTSVPTARPPNSPPWAWGWTALAQPPWSRWWCKWKNASAWQKRNMEKGTSHWLVPRSPSSLDFQPQKLSHDFLWKQNLNRKSGYIRGNRFTPIFSPLVFRQGLMSLLWLHKGEVPPPHTLFSLMFRQGLIILGWPQTRCMARMTLNSG